MLSRCLWLDAPLATSVSMTDGRQLPKRRADP